MLADSLSSSTVAPCDLDYYILTFAVLGLLLLLFLPVPSNAIGLRRVDLSLVLYTCWEVITFS